MIASLAPCRTVVLGYHRVAREDHDSWSLCVSPDHFEDHLRRITARARVRRLEEVVRDPGEVSAPTIVVTFDDGYAETLARAAPLLERYGVPAAVFIPTGYLDSDAELFWDALERLFLGPHRLPEAIGVELESGTRRFSLAGARDYPASERAKYRAWRAWEPPPTERHAALCELWRILTDLATASRKAVLRQLFEVLDVDARAPENRRILRRSEAVALARRDTIGLGAHSVTHASLASLAEPEQRAEIVDSKAALEILLDRPVTIFAYPFGQRQHFTDATQRLVEDAGFLGACANFPGKLGPDTDRFAVPRLQVEDCSGEELDRLLDRWLET